MHSRIKGFPNHDAITQEWIRYSCQFHSGSAEKYNEGLRNKGILPDIISVDEN
jgi:hypothetical protein